MTVSTLAQLTSLLWGILAGAACGALAGIMSAVRSELRPGRALTMAGDLLFWVFAGAVVIFLNYRLSDGTVRLFQLVAAVCGFILYVLCLGRPTRWLAKMGLRGLRLALSPVFFLCRGLKLYLNVIADKIKLYAVCIKQKIRRSTSADKVRKKIRKNYKKML